MTSLSIHGEKIVISVENETVARAYLYILRNDLHREPFAFIEDVFVEECWRGTGVAEHLVSKVIEIAKQHECYKVIGNIKFDQRIGTTRWYEKFGFRVSGHELRLDPH